MKCGWLASLTAVSLFDANSPGCYGSLICMVCHTLLNIVVNTKILFEWRVCGTSWWGVGADYFSPILLLLKNVVLYPSLQSPNTDDMHLSCFSNKPHDEP